jgi:threonine dehydratase
MGQPRIVSLEEIREAQQHLKGVVLRSPLVPLRIEGFPGEVFLKLENLQPVGSFKLRGAGNAIAHADRFDLQKGVWTASTGNMAQGVAWYARRLGIPCSVVGPRNTPELKQAAVRRLGAEFVGLSWEEYFEVLNTWQLRGMNGVFVHPFADPLVMAGNGTIALEILEDLPDADAIIVAYGGGGLIGGVGAAVRALKSDIRVIAGEARTAAPLSAALLADRIVMVKHEPSFVDAIGSPAVFEQMWPVVREIVDESVAVSLDAVTSAVRLLLESNHIVAEGAGAIPVAAALAGEVGGGKVVCVVSGGNIPNGRLMKILNGQVPE